MGPVDSPEFHDSALCRAASQCKSFPNVDSYRHSGIIPYLLDAGWSVVAVPAKRRTRAHDAIRVELDAARRRGAAGAAGRPAGRPTAGGRCARGGAELDGVSLLVSR